MILFFDTETTGLPINWKLDYNYTNNWPRMVQLSCILSDFDSNIAHSIDTIIKPENYIIPEEVSKIHNITQEIALEKGNNIIKALNIFNKLIDLSDIVVCHNYNFDMNVICSEFKRMQIQTNLLNTNKFCTMMSTINFCKLKNQYGYKFPKLQELHKILFQEEFQNAHDAKNDVYATYKCFFELKRIGHVKIDFE